MTNNVFWPDAPAAMVHLQRFADEPAQPSTLLDCYKRIRSATGNKFSSDHDFFSALCEAAALLANNLTYLMACTRNPFYDYNLEQVHARAIRAETVLASLGKREDVIAGAAEFIGILVALQASGYRDYLGELFHSLELHNSDRGQFFTPHSISTLLGGMTMSTEEVRQRLYDCDDYVEVADGCGCGAGSKFIDEVNAYIRDNMSNPETSVESLSTHLSISRVQLYKRMISLTGITPSEYLRTKRIKFAEHLLRSADLNISEIAYKVGFNNPRYFTKYFQEAYGVTPSQYRKNLSESE
jgi:AraC-like DNA-binding protein